MDFLFGWLTDWIKQGLIEGILGQYAGIYDSINNQVVQIAADVGQTPQGWNSGVFSMIRALSDTAVLPIAGMILTFVLCYELIQLIIEKNNMHEFDTFNIYKWIFKTFVAVYILTHTFDIVMGVFSLAQNVVNASAGVISGSLEVNGAAALAHLETLLQDMGIWELIGLWLETNILHLCMTAITICIFLIIYGRMLEIYLTVSIAPIPLATMANREWGSIGNNYLKTLFALAFQGFLILTCVAIYAALVQSIPIADSVHAAIWGTAGYTILLCFALFKTGSLSKAIFQAH
ncbi:MAG: CD0415/CD1112 family protein [Christensenella sp.]|uniref:VirB6/TrbL-like conjugal transfer protein, CD1112 family n=1 Tax=Christensenella sp. TaxID=1935934 RepID=UPI002B20F7D0|nr:CD0415/CD1112 family protein [Christensenella sp.]MEA5003788.1 CD0415/CD1112 family protein [Christensenella sp.]